MALVENHLVCHPYYCRYQINYKGRNRKISITKTPHHKRSMTLMMGRLLLAEIKVHTIYLPDG